MADDLQTLERRLTDQGPPPIGLIFGEERLLVDRAVRLLLEAGTDDPDDPLSVKRLDLAESGTEVRDVIGACRSIGLFSSRQAVVVRGAEAIAKSDTNKTEILSYLQAPDPQTTLILVADQINRSTSLYKEIHARGVAIQFSTPREWELPRWILGQSRTMGHDMTEATARLVADLTGGSLQGLRLVLDQLSLYVGPGQPIPSDVVEELLAPTRSHNVFELVDAVGERRMPSALGHLHSMLEHREPALRILAMLVRHFRQLWQVAEARACGESMDATQKRLKMRPFVVKKLWSQANRFDAPSLRRAYDQLYRANLQLKST
ncbi:MAG: DNA polymerase III subunit delta, partial [Myxococcota bacterium]|nr:DNA polymerase III subunit delta [Myxococcota bacterium]